MVNNTDSVYFEIPKGELDKDFVWNVALKKTTVGVGFGGQNVSSNVVRWTKRGDRILLQGVNYSITADPSDPVAGAVADANYPAIIRTLPVAAYGPNGEAVVDVTAFFMEGVPGVCRARRGGRPGHGSRPFVPRTRSLVSREHQRRSHADLYGRRGRCRRRRRGWRRRPRPPACAARAARCSCTTAS